MAGDKRKGKAAAAAEPCPLDLFKHGSFSSSTLAAVQASSSCGKRSVAGAVGAVSYEQGMAAGVLVKTELLDSSKPAAAAAEVLVKTEQGGCGVVQGVVAVKVEQQQQQVEQQQQEQNHAEAAAAVAIKQEPQQQQLDVPGVEAAAAVQRTRKRTRRG
jgi:hypothetical protein